MKRRMTKIVALFAALSITVASGLTAFAAESPSNVRFAYENVTDDVTQDVKDQLRQTDLSYDGQNYRKVSVDVFDIIFYQNDVATDYDDDVILDFHEDRGIKPDTLYLILFLKEDGTWGQIYAKSDENGALKVTLHGTTTVAIVELAEQKDVTTVFHDIKSEDWWRPAVQYTYDTGVMVGKGEEFAPTTKLTREEFVQTLYSATQKPEVSGTTAFPDVKDSWYTNAVLWASQKGITAGKGDGTFGVGQGITRQELVVMLYQYAKLNGFDTTFEAGKIDKFSDASKVSSWAKEAMNWAVTQGIVSGTGDNRLDPLGVTSRAECAAILSKLLDR